jgi:hypothetical protein
MVANWYPNGVQPITSAPLFIPITAESPFREPSDGGTYTGPCKLHLYSATQGASIVYAINEEEPKNWHLYTSPISLPLGKHLLKAKAIRIGFAESKEVKANFIIKKNN